MKNSCLKSKIRTRSLLYHDFIVARDTTDAGKCHAMILLLFLPHSMGDSHSMGDLEETFSRTSSDALANTQLVA